ncbi:MAG: DNA ligase (NAD(+)) LigA [Spirochaetaceae bacterium]|jgi:DNA ligase (NAD+)|nr:DNA ligase (NAD(+)) LigA [Spirochaetaceae bacterium]
MNKLSKRVGELEDLITKYQDSYYGGEGEISDAAFDTLWDELKKTAPQSPVLQRIGSEKTAGGKKAGPAEDGFPKAEHLIPMGSQEKASNEAEFREWAEKRGLRRFVVQHKLDGASLELQYKNGVLVRAVTRGDGTIGDDITANARKMQGVPSELGEDFSGGVRGEVIMTHAVWRAKYSGKANCRNAANGLMRRKDGAGSGDLTLIAYDASKTSDDAFFTTETDKVAWLAAKKFNTVETKVFDSAEEVIAYREKEAGRRETLAYDIDGLVIKDIGTDMADLRKARPEKQIAFKFTLEEAVSVLRRVEWSESGATYTPIGVVDPVHLAGTVVQRANLNNPGMIRSMELKIGSAVIVVKRGEIIPKIERRAAESDVQKHDISKKYTLKLDASQKYMQEANVYEIEQPTVCGACGTALTDDDTRLYCPNHSCVKRILHRLYKWTAVLDIRELGEKLVAQLFEKGRVRSVADFYSLTEAELAEYERMGALSAAKVVRHIQTKRVLRLSQFVAGFDFEGVGELIMEKVEEAGFDTLENLRAAGLEQLSAVHGLGEITAKTIVDGLCETRADMDATLAAGCISIQEPPDPQSLPLKGQSFCFTGELSTLKRGDAAEDVKRLGGSVKTSVVEKLSFLVTNTPGSNSAKNKKARELGIPIIGEEEFLKLIGRR